MLRQKLQQDQIQSLKTGDKLKLNILRYVISKIKNKEIEKKAELTDSEVIDVLRKQAKELNESIEAAKRGNREDLIKENEDQLKIVTSYLPQELTDEELKTEIEKIIQENQEAYKKNPKSIIGVTISKLKDRAEPTRIVKILQTLKI